MKNGSCCADKAQCAAYCVGVLGAFLIVAGLVWMLRHYTQAPPPDKTRVAERTKAALEVSQAAKEQLQSYGFIDPAKGQVRLTVDRAVELTIAQWRDPAAGYSNLVARVNRFNPPPPPPKPSPFE